MYLLLVLLLSGLLGAQESDDSQIKKLQAQIDSLNYSLDRLQKAIDDVHWFQRLADVADIDKVTYVGPPNPRAETTYGIENERHPLKVQQYVFVPKKLDRTCRHPLVVLPHGGVHGDFGTYHVHIVREMLDRGWVVVAPEYRGSTGYGRDFQQAIDYGGLEVDDVVAGRDWAVQMLPFVDEKRCALVGWSHGGLIALLALFNQPDKFACAYAGVPVSDVIMRLGYVEDGYRELFSADYHIGKSPGQAVDEYRRRSPVWQVDKLQKPLLIHTSTNDRDVSVVEVESLINALKAHGKKFEYRIHRDAPGGHSFDRIDTLYAVENRRQVYAFLEKYLR